MYPPVIVFYALTAVSGAVAIQSQGHAYTGRTSVAAIAGPSSTVASVGPTSTLVAAVGPTTSRPVNHGMQPELQVTSTAIVVPRHETQSGTTNTRTAVSTGSPSLTDSRAVSEGHTSTRAVGHTMEQGLQVTNAAIVIPKRESRSGPTNTAVSTHRMRLQLTPTSTAAVVLRHEVRAEQASTPIRPIERPAGQEPGSTKTAPVAPATKAKSPPQGQSATGIATNQ